ncbi:Fanconi anemia group M protein [Dorcoceras hygrometricum]|uniref:Fanconi anemia group M protein n=1 Tax=Dorcoceras hygrometricum TaxID=472368 RepID=A0A2Z7BF56_9LAMI|nr:Fanconi anemia group M protein [Dorcoceras hygrometricum]
MFFASHNLNVTDNDDEFDWEAAVREIDVGCQATAPEKPSPEKNSSVSYHFFKSYPVQEACRKREPIPSSSSSRQTTLDKYIGVAASNLEQCAEKTAFSNGTFVRIDPEAAKTWVYPVNISRRDYQFAITQTALFSNTLVVLPTGLGKTFIAAVVMYNYFRWFPEGKIVFAAPTRPLVIQQIEACHKIVGIPQEWTIDMTGQTSPAVRASSCLVKHLVCLVIDEAHRATGNYSYSVAVRELMDVPVQLRILALTATPGSKQQAIQCVIDNLQISTLEYRNESDHDVLPYVHERKIEVIEVAMGDEAVEISNLLLDVKRPFAARLCALGVLQNIDFQMLSPCNLLNSRDKFRQEPPVDLPHMKYGEIEGYFGVLITLYHVRKLLTSHGIRPAFEMLEEKLKQGSFARFMSRNEVLLKAKLLMEKTVSNGAPSPKLVKMLDVLTDHFKVKDPQNSRVIIFSNFRGSVRDIMSALENIGEYVKAVEFIGQSSGKVLKGQTQKVQQAVLKKFRTGGFNVLVATSIGEEGLDIMEVDLVICFDANISPLRMIQRMGRTGRKHEGRVDIHHLVLYLEGFISFILIVEFLSHIIDNIERSELKGYMRKKANSKSINKHMRNGGLSSFNFHSSPRMVPHCFRPKVQFLKMSIEQYVPRGKKVKDGSPVSVPANKTKLVEDEMDLLAKYFTNAIDVSWKPSLLAFPQFQAFPSPVNEVLHSSRTCMLIDTMQCLQGRSFSKEKRSIFTKDEDISYPSLSVEAVEPHQGIIKGYEHLPVDMFCCLIASTPAEGHFNTLERDKELEKTTRTREMRIEGLDKQKPFGHTLLFGAESTSIDDPGDDLVLSSPQFPLQSHLKSINNIGVSSIKKLMDNSANGGEIMQAKGNLSPQSSPPRGISRKSNEMDISGEAHEVVYSMIPVVDIESSNEFRDSDLSPRLTNFIKSGIVPESPLSKCNCDEERSMVPAFASTPQVQAQISMNSKRDEEKETNSPYMGEGVIQTPALDLNKNAPSVCESPVPVAKEAQMPFDKSSNSSSSKDWLEESVEKSEPVEQHHKLRRLRKHGDLSRKVPPESKGQIVAGVNTKIKPVKGKGRQAKNVGVYIHDEAEVSSEVSVSDDEEDEQIDSSYEDSFIDDGVNSTLADSHPGVSRTDMMAIYRRSLLSQSPFQRIPNVSTDFSPASMVPSCTMNETGSLSQTSHNRSTETGLESTAKNLGYISAELDNERRPDGRKRKLSFFLAQSVPMVNLDNKFSLLSDSIAKTSSRSLEIQNMQEKIDDVFEDDEFYEGIDLDAVEEEASKQLRECCIRNIALTNDATTLNLGIQASPSFDLGV